MSDSEDDVALAGPSHARKRACVRKPANVLDSESDDNASDCDAASDMFQWVGTGSPTGQKLELLSVCCAFAQRSDQLIDQYNIFKRKKARVLEVRLLAMLACEHFSRRVVQVAVCACRS